MQVLGGSVVRVWPLGVLQYTSLKGLCCKRHATSRFNGVSLNREGKAFRAQVMVRNIQYHLGSFDSEIAAAQAYDQKLRTLCPDDGIRLQRSLNFPTIQEASVSLHERREQALQEYSEPAGKEEESFRRLQTHFMASPQALTYEILRVSRSSKVDAIFQTQHSAAGGTPLQLKSASASGHRRHVFSFSKVRGYDGMLVIMIALDNDLMWAAEGACIGQKTLRITLGSDLDRRLRVNDIGATLEQCFRRREVYPHLSLREAKFRCSRTNKVEEQAHSLLAIVFAGIDFRLERAVKQTSAVDSFLLGGQCELKWRVQEKASNLSKANRYAINLWRRAGRCGRRPYSESEFDVLLAAILDDGRTSALFAFPSHVLAKHGLVGQEPKRVVLYPPWAMAEKEATRRRHAWQLEYFVDLRIWSGDTSLPPSICRGLQHLMRKLAA